MTPATNFEEVLKKTDLLDNSTNLKELLMDSMMFHAENVYMLRHVHPINDDRSKVQKALASALAQATHYATSPKNSATSLWKNLESRIQKVMELIQPSHPAIHEDQIISHWMAMISAIEAIQDDNDRYYDEYRRAESQKRMSKPS